MNTYNDSSDSETTEETSSIESEHEDDYESGEDSDITDAFEIEPEREVYNYDREFFYSKKRTNTYYIGTYEVVYYNNIYEPILDIAVSRNAFFKFSFDLVLQYLHLYNSGMYVNNSQSLEIIKLYIQDNVYIAIIKTFWIKIIQRTWKRIMKERYRILQVRKRLNSIHYREKTGMFPLEIRYLPNLYGMLCSLQR
jgi:hypothetical protein